jgi:hypothetical protein
MAESFPASLQQKFNQAGFQLTFGDSAIETPNEVGPPKKRQRYTKEFDDLRGTIELERTDYADFETFFKTTLAGGTLTFNYDHPISGVTGEYQFKGRPSITTLGGTYFRISFVWRQIA